MAAPTTTNASSTPAEPPLPRVIPGFTQRPAAPTKTRSRAKKSGNKDVASAVATAGVSETATAPEASGLSTPLLATGDEMDEAILAEKKTTSASEACAKRIRAATKKIQRIVTYEEKTEALNADQQKAVASKPTLEAIVKELQELLVILKAEEAEDNARLDRIKATEEKRHSSNVDVAVTAAQKEGQSHLVMLLQFFHLHGIFTQQQSGFAPPTLPSVLAQASANDVAAVRCLFDGLTNGPLLGGHGDAVEKVTKVAQGSDEEIILGITYGRIQELIHGLTSPPHDPSASEPVTESTLPAGPSDSVTALVEGDQEEQPAAPTFLQSSELTEVVTTPTPQEKVSSWADDVEPTAAEPTPLTNGHSEEAALPPAVPAPTANSWGAPATGKPIDWASEEQSSELPPLEGLVPEKKVVAPSAEAESDGFQSVAGNGPRRGGERGGFRGGDRGSFRGNGRGGGERRGSFRGRGRGGFEQGGERPPREEGWTRAPREGGENGPRRGGFNGEGRGGGFGGEGRGRGARRGAPRGASKPAEGAPPVQRDW